MRAVRRLQQAGRARPGNTAEPRRTGFIGRHRRAVITLLAGAVTVGFIYYVVPEITGFGPTLRRLRSGNAWWLGAGVPLEALSLTGYIVLFRGVFGGSAKRIGWAASYQITMAGTVATKVLAAAGSGGVALTVWALRAAGLPPSVVATRMVGFEIVNYGVYMAALVIAGFGLWIGLFDGSAPAGLTLIPALFGVGVIVLVLSMQWIAGPAERFMLQHAVHSGTRVGNWWSRAARFPRALQDGLGSVVELVRSGDRSWLGAVAAWGFDIATLWVSFRAFGHSPPGAVLVLGYYVGTLANVLPLPGGIGGVEGGMIGAFLGFGVNGSLAVLAVLAYRTISYWLPTFPGAVAYLQLRRTVGEWRTRPHSQRRQSAASETIGRLPGEAETGAQASQLPCGEPHTPVTPQRPRHADGGPTSRAG